MPRELLETDNDGDPSIELPGRTPPRCACLSYTGCLAVKPARSAAKLIMTMHTITDWSGLDVNQT